MSSSEEAARAEGPDPLPEAGEAGDDTGSPAAVGDLVVTIDGPAGSGKSTTARAVARRLGLRHLDSGALYRGVTYALLEEGVPPEAWEEVSLADLRELPLEVRARGEEFQVLYDGQVLEGELRTENVTRHVSTVSALPAVRRRLLDLQRSAAEKGGLVADGRDMGTVVFPNADVKVFLTADLRERARRRVRERTGGDDPDEARVDREVGRIAERDRRDSEREISPLRRPEGALVVDTTARTFEEQVRTVVDRVKRAASRA